MCSIASMPSSGSSASSVARHTASVQEKGKRRGVATTDGVPASAPRAERAGVGAGVGAAQRSQASRAAGKVQLAAFFAAEEGAAPLSRVSLGK